MDAVEKMSLSGNLVYVFAAVAAVGLIMAVLFFFLFDIRNVHALMTGKAKRDAIERMAEQNSRTGRLRESSGNIREKSVPVVQHPSKEVTADIQPVAQAGMGETVALRRDETTVLSGAGETTVLGGDVAGETAVLTRPGAQPEPAIRFDVTESTLVIHTNEII